MATPRTWVWILVAALGVGLIALMAVAGAGVYFVTSHIKTEQSTSADAIRSFDAVKALFPHAQPIFELDDEERPRIVRPLNELATSGSKPESLWILAWDPEEQRLVKASVPLWLLRFGHGTMDIGKDGRRFDLERLELDGEELERIGPALLFDIRHRDGVRVLLWTE